MGITEALCNYNTAFIQHCSYVGIFVLMALESMIAPIPSELVMPFAGFLIFSGYFDPVWVVVASSLGSLIGSLLSYGMGVLGEPAVLRYGRYLFLNPHHLEWTKNFFARRGNITIFVSRFIPVVRHLISIPAGLARMSLTPFILYTVAGATLEHPHAQLIALPIVPKHVLEELEGAKQYYAFKERCVFCDIIRQETDESVRVVAENEGFLTLAPYAPRFPFETWVLPKKHESAFEGSSSQTFEQLARALKNLLQRTDAVLDSPSYNLAIHTAPVQEGPMEHYHWHIEFMPRLTKIAGFEWGSGFYQNPTPPEEAAKYLREAKIKTATPAVVG